MVMAKTHASSIRGAGTEISLSQLREDYLRRRNLSAMTIIPGVIQIVFYVTLAMAQNPPNCPSTVNWFHQATFNCNWDSNYLWGPPYVPWNQYLQRRDDYTYTPGIGGYKVHTRAVPWNEGRLICNQEGGYLAILNSKAEANVVGELFRNAPPITGSTSEQFAAIGFHDRFRQGQFVTIHSQTLEKAGFSEWADGQPDNWHNNEHCGSLYKRTGKLNDVNCDIPLGFICEIPVL
ncbi:hemolymph lipopolysaccharide-binding protein-like [Diprion similis]|uniref:hemolymph lipopolysaccharide-binding protein-like n=1 Tax=Diprion similis TaxID=362088 RepID=UPI001EF75913|nr:hemolymph lipopolysaccharide-binding protein-like [Diprion similis]